MNGREHTIKGTVGRGQGRGRQLGFPTANLAIRAPAPAPGVYAGRVSHAGKIFPAAVFISRKKDMAEAHLIGFTGDLYGREIVVRVGKKIRAPQAFKSDRELAAQIRLDIEAVIKAMG